MFIRCRFAPFELKRISFFTILITCFIPTLLLLLPPITAVYANPDRYATVSHAAGLPHDPPSVYHACAGEMALLCPDTPHRVVCFLSAITREGRTPDHTFSPTCQSYLSGRESCVRAVRLGQNKFVSKLCGDTINVRECLRRVPSHSLPSKCARSLYYRSVLLAPMLSHGQN
ncbi:hypothetical protein ADEAN_000159200 [Angomonas deanei]|uniref:Uncharacterized protein n=1 Tax=Angomonas deanei TaxID=59799 RepID=A0A7G2C2Y3_9TRYP|nr:hypothetical protein ADEAN_000159200 [Angomonas deanei]